MFSFDHSVSFNLHQAIIENNIDLFLAELKQYPAKIQTRDKKGRTPLQLAAMTGNIHVILNLLYEGADIDFPNEKTPFFLALHFQQYIAAHLLYYAGAKKSLALKNNPHLAEQIGPFSPDLRLYNAMLLWTGMQTDEIKKITLLKKMLANVSPFPPSNLKSSYYTFDEEKNDLVRFSNISQPLASIIELLEQKKHFKAAEMLYGKFPDIIKTTPASATWGYWAAVNSDPTEYKLIEHNFDHLFLTLHQLQTTGKDQLFQKKFISLSHEKQIEYASLSFPEDKLSGFSKIIYAAAKYAKHELLKSYTTAFDVSFFVETAEHSLKHNNYVALSSLFNQQVDLFFALLEASQSDLLLIQSFLKEKLPRMTAKQFQTYLHLISKGQGIPGAINQFIFQGLGVVDARPKDEIQFQKQFFNLSGIDEKQWIHAYFKIHHQREDICSLEDIRTKIPADRWHTIIDHAKRFNFMLPLADEKKHSSMSVIDQVLNAPGIVSMVRGYLTLSENSRLNEVSSLFLKTDAHTLIHDIEVFLIFLEETISHTLSAVRKKYISALSIVMILSAGILVLSSKFIHDTNIEINHIFDILYALNSTTGAPCSDWLPHRHSLCNSAPPSPCNIYCDQLPGLNNINDISVLGAAISPGFLIFSPLLCWVFYPPFSSDNKSLSAYPIVEEKAIRLFSKFRGDSEFNLTPESNITQVKSTLQSYISRLTLFKTKDSAIIEINEEKALLPHTGP